MCRSVSRVLLALLTITALIASDSRGAIIAWLVSLIVFVIAFKRVPQASGRQSQYRLLLPVLVICGLAVGSWILGGSISEYLLSARVNKGVKVFTEGAGADENLGARIETWSRALDYHLSYPLGTLGSPEALFKSYIDNEFLRSLLQGGALFLLSYVALLVSGYRLGRTRRTQARFVALASLVILVDAITSLPLSSPAAYIFWLVSGYTLDNCDLTVADEPSGGGII